MSSKCREAYKKDSTESVDGSSTRRDGEVLGDKSKCVGRKGVRLMRARALGGRGGGDHMKAPPSSLPATTN
eukprot:3838476-Rhodomonas_salina.1